MKNNAAKSLVATTNRVTQIKTVLSFPVAQNYLPIENVKVPNQQLSRDKIYNNDARNPMCILTLTTQNTVQNQQLKDQNNLTKFNDSSKHQIKLKKTHILDLFAKLEKIQDQLNQYN